MKRMQTLVVAVALGLALPASSSAAGDRATSDVAQAMPSEGGGPLTAGEVKKIDPGAGKVTIRHAPIENLGMPAMTMVFRVKDPAMLGQLKEGDKINFFADRVNGAITIMQLEPAK